MPSLLDTSYQPGLLSVDMREVLPDHIAQPLRQGLRQRAKDERGETMPYVNLGPVVYLNHTGARPMSIHWELLHEMPMGLYQETKRAAG